MPGVVLKVPLNTAASVFNTLQTLPVFNRPRGREARHPRRQDQGQSAGAQGGGQGNLEHLYEEFTRLARD